jgi:hypothetical protein
MQKWGFLFLISISGFCALAQEPWGSIDAEPNPCRIEPGQAECTSFIRWETRGVDRAKVFVTSEGRHGEAEREFGTTLSCETRRCRAPWINADTTYTFQLVNFTRGDRGRVLASVTVTARGGGGGGGGERRRDEGGAEGTISADPNPCRIRRGEGECTTFLTWHTRGVDRAKVFVTSEGKRREVQHEFSLSPNCEPGNCRAPWIAPETTYTFELVDFTRDDRGRVLASVTVTGVRSRR